MARLLKIEDSDMAFLYDWISKHAHPQDEEGCFLRAETSDLLDQMEFASLIYGDTEERSLAKYIRDHLTLKARKQLSMILRAKHVVRHRGKRMMIPLTEREYDELKALTGEISGARAVRLLMKLVKK